MNFPAGTERLLVRTRNSDLWAKDTRDFHTSYVAVTADGARWLVEHVASLNREQILALRPGAWGDDELAETYLLAGEPDTGLALFARRL